MIKKNRFKKTAVNIIKSDKYPRMTVSGLSHREKIKFTIIRRLTDNKIVIKFKLLKPQSLYMAFS
ncbi:hypothetical protein J7L67_01740, partial [bacterium]|nr:hypothetical protein [bacterium]